MCECVCGWMGACVCGGKVNCLHAVCRCMPLFTDKRLHLQGAAAREMTVPPSTGHVVESNKRVVPKWRSLRKLNSHQSKDTSTSEC